MSVLKDGTRRWRKARKRGVSPIIATILLVAITVVLAAVLYVLVSGLTRSGASTPYSLQMATVTGSATGSGANWFDPMALIPTAGLTTSMFGLTITGPSQAVYGLSTAVGGTGCTLSAGHAAPASWATGATGCNGPATASTWYGVLVASNNSIMGLYLNAAGVGTWTYADGLSTIALTSSYTLFVVSSTQLTGLDYTISAFTTGTSSVSGSGLL